MKLKRGFDILGKNEKWDFIRVKLGGSGSRSEFANLEFQVLSKV